MDSHLSMYFPIFVVFLLLSLSLRGVIFYPIPLDLELGGFGRELTGHVAKN